MLLSYTLPHFLLWVVNLYNIPKIITIVKNKIEKKNC